MLIVILLLVAAAISTVFVAQRLRQRARVRHAKQTVHEWTAAASERRPYRPVMKPSGARNRRRRLRRRKVCRSASRQQRKLLRRTVRQTKSRDRWRFQ